MLWPHNFNKQDTPNAGVFMELSRRALHQVGIKPVLLYLGNLRSARGILQARRLVRDAAPNFALIHAQFGSACAVSSVGHGRPTLISLRGSDWTAAYSPNLRDKAHALLATRMTRFAVRHASGVVSVSNRIAGEVEAFTDHPRVCVAPGPIDLDVFRPRDKFDSRQRLGLDPSATYVLFTTESKTNPLKRLELAQAAVVRARERIPNVELLIASGRPHSEMPLITAAADCALLTSVAEGWPNCVKEALACDVPFVSTDVSDLKSIADIDQRCRVADATPEALGDSLVAVLTDTKSRSGLRTHLSSMSYEAFAHRLRDFYQQTIEDPPLPAS